MKGIKSILLLLIILLATTHLSAMPITRASSAKADICLGRKAIVEICLVPESIDVDNERIEGDIRETLKCDWLKEIEKVTVQNGI